MIACCLTQSLRQVCLLLHRRCNDEMQLLAGHHEAADCECVCAAIVWASGCKAPGQSLPGQMGVAGVPTPQTCMTTPMLWAQ